MILYPALRINGKVYKGKREENHNAIGLRVLGDRNPPESSRGFSPDSRLFLTRTQAIGFLKKHDRDVYNNLPKAAQQGMHSEHLADAYGVTQSLFQEPDEVKDGKKSAIPGEERINPKEVDKKDTKVDLSELTAIVYDRGGLSLDYAEVLAEKYKKVYYFMLDGDSYPNSQKASIGAGLKNIERVHDLYKYIDKCDIIYDFDCYDGEFTHWLRGKGYTVFSSSRGAQIEVDKIKFLETLEELGLPCPKTYLAEGLDDLEDYLGKHDGETLYLKNLNRGDFESKKFNSLAQLRPFLTDLKKRLGTACDTLEVLVQHKIDAACEAGYDGFQVDGEYTDNCLCGYEIKDVCYVGKIFPETPEVIKQFNDAFAPIFKKLGYRGVYSTEIRITEEGVCYYIDCTARRPEPPGALECRIYENWAEATYQIACGIVPKLKPIAKYGVQVVLTSQWYDEHELYVKFPAKFKENIMLKNHTKRDGDYYCIPNGNGAFWGAAVAWGNTLKEAIDKVCEVCESIEADEFEFDANKFKKAHEQIESGEKFGIKF